MTGITTFLSEMSSQAVWMGLDVAAKATVVLLLAVAVNRLLNGRVLARAAVWNALLVGLILLPAATALFPRLRICCLPPTPTEATVEIPAESPLPEETAVPDEVLTAPDEDQNSLLSFLAAGSGEGHSLTDLRATAVEPESVGPQAEPRVGVEAPFGIAANPATSSPRWPGVIVCVYLLGVATLALRLTLSFLAVRRLRGQSVPLEDSRWTTAMAAWRERLGIRQAVQLGVSSAVSVPIQIGWLKPMVVLPAEMMGDLDPARHGSILLHELAHVRRRDYGWQILLKIVQIIYWPHPLIWLAGRMIGANREQVCDDLCVHHSSSAGQYRATLLEVASVLVRRPTASLGIAMARTSKIGGRLDRIDRGCRLSRCLARWPVRLAIVAAVLVTACMIAPVELAHRDAEDSKTVSDVSAPTSTQPAEATSQPEAGPTAAASQPTDAKPGLELLVLHQVTGEPLGGVEVRIRIDNQRQTTTTNKQGQVRIALPGGQPDDLIITCSKDKFVPMGVFWIKRHWGLGIPPTFTMRMEPGTVIGGQVQDEEGKPVANAVVSLELLSVSEDAAHAVYPVIRDHDVRTDTDGRWSCDIMPAKIERLRLRLSHPDYLSDGQYDQTPTPAMEKLRDLSALLVIKKGLTIRGVVRDTTGNPIAGASVSPNPDKRVLSWYRDTETDSKGQFELKNVRPGAMVITVRAKGFAPSLTRAEATPDTAPLDIRMEPGRTLRIRVVNGKGEPIAGANAWAREWRDFRTIPWHGETDQQGRLAMPDAPPDAVQFEIQKNGYMGLSHLDGPRLVAGDTENVVTLKPVLKVSGKVTDARTGRPIPRLEVVPGSLGKRDKEAFWQRTHTKTHLDGKYEIQFDSLQHAYQFRIEAAGYAPAVSQVFKGDEGQVEAYLALQPDTGKGPAGVVLGPDRKPLAGAKVFLSVGETIVCIRNGRTHNDQSYSSTTTGPDGRFSFPPEEAPWAVVVIDDRGFAMAKEEQLASSPEVVIEPWGRIEGVLKIGAKPGTNEKISIYYEQTSQAPGISLDYQCGTDGEGRFVIDRMVPGDVTVGRQIVLQEFGIGMRAAPSHIVPVEVESGQTAHVTIGGTGRPVVGRIRAAEGSNPKVDWNWGHGSIAREPRWPVQYFFRLGPDGSFRVEDVPAGTYGLRVEVMEPAPGGFFDFRDKTIGILTKTIEVPEMPGGRSDEPLDLGTLEIELRPSEPPTATQPSANVSEGRSGDLPYKATETKPAPVTATQPAPAAAVPTRVLDVRVVHLNTSEPIADADAVFNFEGEPQVTLKTDSGGRCQFRYPDRPGHHGLNVRKAGLLSLSYWGDRVNSIPPNLTFKMEPGIGIGGFVKNAQGQPVAKAEVKVSVGSTRQEQLTGIRVNTYHEPVSTDERGYWEVAGLPSDLSRLHVTAKHPDYLYRELNPGTGLPAGQLLDKSAIIVLEKGIELAGTLLDEDGKPIAELPVLGTETDQDGRFHAVGIEPSSQGFLIKVPGYLAHSVGPRIYAGMPPLEIRLQRAITVRGRVTDTAGKPVKGTHISTQLKQWLDTRVSPHGPLARTDADGRFVLDDMRPDKWVLRIYDNNYKWLDHELTLTRGETPADLHLVLQPTILGTIRGIVLAKDGSTPVAGAIIGNDHDRTSRIGTPTDKNGRFELSGLRPANNHLHTCVKEGYAPVTFMTSIAQDGTSAEQRIVLDKLGGTITGRGFDATANAPLADEVIVACAQDYPGTGIASHLRATGNPSTLADLERSRFHGIHYRTQTGNDGSYQLTNLPEGFYTVCLIRRASTRHLWKEFVHVLEGGTTADVDLTLKPEPAIAVKKAEPPPRPADKPAPGPAGSLSGTVYLPDGKTPAKGIKVAPYTKDRNRHNMQRDKIVITSADGAFSFDGLAAGRYGVYAWLLEDNGFSREALPTPTPAELARSAPTLSSLVQVKGGQATTGVKVTLNEGAVVKGTVTDGDTGQPMAGAWVSINDHGAEYILFVRVSDPRNPFDPSSSEQTFTDAQGRYAFYCMPAQRYGLSAGTQNDKHDQVSLDSFTLKKGEDRTIDVQLQPARYATLTGRVLMPDGRPAAGAEVCIGSLSNKAIADAQGYYRHERVRVYSDPRTSPSIFARAENTAMTSVRAPKMKPSQTVPFDISLLAGGVVTGRVTRADGSAPKDGTLACLMRAGGPGPEMSYRDVLKPENRYEHFWVRVEPDGSYRLEHIPPNKYHLFALSDDKPHNIIKDLNIKDGATLKKDLKLSP